MYLHLGGNGVVRTKDIIGIFDLDKTTVSASTRGYLAAKEKQKKVVTLGEGLPQSFVITANKKKEAKIEELKSKKTLKRGRPKNSDKKVKNNINKRKKLKSEIDENKEKIRKYKAKIKEHVEYKETIKKIFRAKSFKTAMKYFNQLYDKLEELPPIIKNFIKTLSKKNK